MFADVVDWAGSVPDDAVLAALRASEERARTEAARRSVLLAELERRGTFRRDDHASMFGLLRSQLHWSDTACRDAMRLARFVDTHLDVGEALFEAWVSISNADELAKAVHRVDASVGDDGLDGVAERELGALMRLAERSEHHETRIAAREWATRHARTAVDTDAADVHEHRHATVTVTAEGREINGSFGTMDAAELAEIFAHYVDAEWRTDWDAAVTQHGDNTDTRLLARTDRQRLADALIRIFRDAVSAPPGSRRPEPVVNIHVDHATATDILIEAQILPDRNVDPFEDPHPISTPAWPAPTPASPSTTPRSSSTSSTATSASSSATTTASRSTGAGNDACSTAPHATPSDPCPPDVHTRAAESGSPPPTPTTPHDWALGGTPGPANGNPRCSRHDNTKNRGCTVMRTPNGRFHTHRPDGTRVWSRTIDGCHHGRQVADATAKGATVMEYEFRQGEPITEEEALAQIAAIGFHGLAFDDVHDEDEVLHWHEFDTVAYVISGTGSFADEHGNVTHTQPGCTLRAPAGWLHRTLAGTDNRIVLGTNLPYDEWTMPIDKDPADRPAELAT